MKSRAAVLTPILAFALLAGSLAADAQQAARIPCVAWLRPGSAPDPMLEAFRQGLRDLDYIEGKSIVIEARWAEGKSDRLPPSRGRAGASQGGRDRHEHDARHPRRTGGEQHDPSRHG